MANYALPASFLVGFFLGYLTRKNMFLVRQLLGTKKPTNAKKIEGKASKKDNSERGSVEPTENGTV